MTKHNRGFTLIEMLVVISIIGILSSLAIVSLNDARLKARDAKRSADVNTVYTALQIYYDDVGEYPICVCSGGEPTATCWNGVLTTALENADDKPYISPVPRDPKENSVYYYAYCSDAGKDFIINYVSEGDSGVVERRGF